MTASFVTSASGGANVNLKKLAPLGMHGKTPQLLIQGYGRVYPPADVNFPQIFNVANSHNNRVPVAPGASVTSDNPGPITGGTSRIYIVGSSTQAGTLFVDTSTDGGSTWAPADSEAIPAGETVHGFLTTTAGENRFRLRFTAGQVGAEVAFASAAY
jgi:hypothetical protein